MYGKSSNVIDERCEDLQFLCWMKNIVKINSYVMIKFSTRMFMIVIELKKKLSYSNINVLFLKFLPGVIDSELIFFLVEKI